MSDLKTTIFDAVQEDLFCIEKALLANLKPHFKLVSRISGHILFSGGKRLRALLMILCARMCGYSGQNEFKYSTIFEYLHAATLLHDDVLDGAELRRGNTVANRLWDCSTVLLTGDFLLARSLSIAADTGMCSIVEVISDVAEKISQGEIRQLERKKDFLLTESEYLDIIFCKTAVMFRGACVIGGLLACVSKQKLNFLAEYGYNLGMAFQMADDLLDYSQNFLNTGKKTGADLREGKLTIPVIFSMSRAVQSDKDIMCSILSSANFSKVEFDWFVDILNKYGGIEYTRQKALKHVEKAKKILKNFGCTEVVSILSNIASYAIARSG